jgi:hypothetical protein
LPLLISGVKVAGGLQIGDHRLFQMNKQLIHTIPM